MYNIDTIQWDMDGVLTNLHQCLAEMDGFDSLKEWEEYQRARLNMPTGDIVYEALNRQVKNDCFYRANPMPDFEKIKSMIYQCKSNGYKVNILSSHGTEDKLVESIIEQKIAWLKKHFGDDLHNTFDKVQIVRGSSKKLDYSNNTSILIDDYIKTYNRFSELGLPIILHTSASSTFEELKTLGVLK